MTIVGTFFQDGIVTTNDWRARTASITIVNGVFYFNWNFTSYDSILNLMSNKTEVLKERLIQNNLLFPEFDMEVVNYLFSATSSFSM